jgi:hypothetical protein
VRELLRHGAQVDARSGRGSTPLQLAAHSTGAGGTAGTAAEQREIVDLLINHGASATEG